MSDPAVAEGPGVGQDRIELDAAVAGFRVRLMDRDETVARSNDALELKRERLVCIGPSLSRSEDALGPSIGLADVVGQVRVLVGNVGIERRQIGITTLQGVNERRNVRDGLQERSEGALVRL